MSEEAGNVSVRESPTDSERRRPRCERTFSHLCELRTGTKSLPANARHTATMRSARPLVLVWHWCHGVPRRGPDRFALAFREVPLGGASAHRSTRQTVSVCGGSRSPDR